MNPNANPTGLRVGMTGRLSGIRYRVAGRVVLGMEQDGETCYWQEFHLLEDGGRSATLVFEETEDGPEWKLFMLFDPLRPLTVAEAAGKRVGDTVNLEGRPVTITLVDESRVYHIEGCPPEGVELGDVANYFNADEGPRMLVVSWTGNEIEYYRGVDVPAQEVRRAFGLPDLAPATAVRSAYAARSDEEPSASGWISKVAVAALIAIIGYGAYTKWNRSRLQEAPRQSLTRVTLLPTGMTGSLAGKLYTVGGQATVQVFRPASRYNWLEYHLQDDAGKPALLIGGLNVGANEWFLFQPVPADGLPSPRQAAALRVGDAVNFGGRAWRVLDLFQCRVVNREGQAPVVGEFGFLARMADDRALVRWSENAIGYFIGRQVPEKEVLAAFVPRSK